MCSRAAQQHAWRQDQRHLQHLHRLHPQIEGQRLATINRQSPIINALARHALWAAPGFPSESRSTGTSLEGHKFREGPPAACQNPQFTGECTFKRMKPDTRLSVTYKLKEHDAVSASPLGFCPLAYAPLSTSSSGNAQTSPGLQARTADLPSAPEPQIPKPQSDQKPDQPKVPSLEDLGITPQQARADRDAQASLDRRTHDLKVHQTLGLITLAPITAACLTSALAGPDPAKGNNETGRDIHVALGSASVALYGATAFYAIKAPRIPGQGPTKGGIKLHKYLVAIHAPGMVLTPILGAMAYNQAANGQRVSGIASAHGAVALITVGTYAASIVAVSWPIRLPGHHANAASATSSTSPTRPSSD